ncbi:hormogonium polysaccharide biosynthesis glycosyltransferase HpsE [Phormidium sp. CCY1219]|uniref:hormogonium polysaccharide biosynthesis glycosyltransferase HpsE n=1 Tax=Phormidium sp. CCY1219 TaxID=2886104 RepID=UPI002D1F07BC|nr:hormogonium polysaccharide biosynthesis glycosyltransferase HpsE [Phormidium sp. CCY1219]MEB3831301.1 hormogonium polysaccharide biosynthesis glycosyltransferase HpsE [Phormidium sp. CCY1219]
MVDLTVAICTYNGEKRVPEVLEALESQVNAAHFSWEILVVDNNSSDRTAQVVRSLQEKWPNAPALKYCFEEQQGAGFARKRAVQEAQSPLIGFLDDDNIPAPDWVAAAYNFGMAHPQVGAYGSQIQGEFEAPLPPNFERILPYLAITQRGDAPLPYEPRHRVLPPSAGLVVRSRAWRESVPRRCILNGRVPGSMVTGEDLEVLAYIQQAGWEIWYNPRMQIKHKIPRQRLQREYLIPFFRGIGWSRHVTRMVRIQPRFRPLAVVAFMVSDLHKIIRHWLKYRREVQTDLVAACELELLVASFTSFFYLWQNGYLNQNQLSQERESQTHPAIESHL